MASSAPPKQSGWRVRPRDQRTLLIIIDILVAYLALAGALFFWNLRDQWNLTFFSERVNPNLWFYFLPFIWIIFLLEMYDPHRAKNKRRTIIGITLAITAGLLFYALLYLMAPKGSLPRWGVGVFLILAGSFTIIWRLIYIRIFTGEAFLRRVLVVGAGKAGRTLAQVYHDLQPKPFCLVGFIDDDSSKRGQTLEGFPILSTSKNLNELVEKEYISDLVIAITGEMCSDSFQSILEAQEEGVDVIPMPTLYEELLGRVPIHHLESEWLVRSFVDESRVNGFYELVKRVMDILFAIMALTVYGLIYPFLALVIILDSGLPVLYKQVRSGKGGKPYSFYKFRTMNQDAEKDGIAHPAVENDPRITRIGQFLRRTHIDELPQAWNVLLGEMSVIGPRAERPELVEKYQKVIPFYRARLLVKPGLTGWAQVNYGYSATIEENTIKQEYDLYYIKHRSLLMDVTVILRTIWQVVGFRGR
jgi:exopolysaccharide biosynthesis polyprenyl glycosylphosphotransferase